MSLFALVACASAFSAQEAKTVTITSRGGTVAEIIKQVVDQTSLKVAAGEVAKLPVIIKVEKMEAKVFLEILADAVGADWYKDGEGVVMKRDTSLSASTISEDRDNRFKLIAQAQKSTAKGLEPQIDWSAATIQKRVDEAAARIRKIEEKPGLNEQWIQIGNGQSPANLVLHEAIRKIPTKVLAELVGVQRVVFSSSPTPLQRALPYNPTSIGDFLQARSRLVAAASKLPSGPYHRVYTGLPREKEKFDQVGDLLVRVTPQGTKSSSMTIDVLLVSTKGEIIASAASSLYFGQGFAPGTNMPKGKVTIGPESLKLARALSVGNMHPFAREYDVAYPSSPWKFDKLTQEVVPLLTDPVGKEPVGFAVADAMFAMGDHLKKGVIAYVPDPAATRAMQRIGGSQVNFEQVFGDAGAYGLRIENRQVLFAGTDGTKSMGEPWVDRTAIAKLVDKIRTQGFLRFEDISAYVADRGQTITSYDMDFRYAMGCAPTIASQITQISPLTLRVYRSLGLKIGALPVGQRDIPVAQWSGPVREEFNRMLSTGQFRFYRDNMTEVEQNEPTETYVADLANRVQLRLNVGNMDAAYAVDKDGDGRFLFPYQLGNRQNPLNNNNMIGPRSFERYRRADIRTVNLAFVVQQNGNAANPAISQVVISSGLTRSSSSFQANMSLQAVREVTLMGDKDLTLDEFPESFRKQVDNAKRQKGPLFSPDQVGYKPIIPPQP